MLFAKKIIEGMLKTDSIRVDLDKEAKIYKDATWPILQAAKASLVGVDFTSTAFGKKFVQVVTKASPVRQRDPILALVGLLESFNERLQAISDLIRESMDRTVTENGLDTKKANILEYSGYFAYINKYVPLALTSLMVEVTDDAYRTDKNHQYNMNWLLDNISDFETALNLLATPLDKTLATLKKIPSISIAMDSSDAMSAGISSGQYNPLSMGFINPKLNPFFYLTRWQAEYQDAKYNRSIEQKIYFEQQIANQKVLKAGKEDAAIEAAIQYYQDQIARLDDKISEYEGTL